ncbi:MAG TPA: 3-deoxy-8-phosphooctulonate synthase [Candidatus Polarisedimenticolia bacterium]|nr:3-deoxy-8-phosphooctulonate synthase [Candidatus Polarisedimenticolia bacterium]
MAIAPDLAIGGGAPLAFIAGPCVIESERHVLAMARALAGAAAEAGVPFIFKSSFDKANRSSAESFRGPGLREGLRILMRVKSEVAVPVLSDIHEPGQAEAAAEVLDILQIPAFLCRQTDLLTAAGRTGRPVNIKKGQFLSPWEMQNAVDKVRSAGNERVLVTERGSSFGYQNLVVDFRSLAVMKEIGCPVIMDATHSVQHPGGLGDRSGGDARFIPFLARAAAAVGIDALFCEVHDDPGAAKSDGPNSLPLDAVVPLLRQVIAIDAVVRSA